MMMRLGVGNLPLQATPARPPTGFRRMQTSGPHLATTTVADERPGVGYTPSEMSATPPTTVPTYIELDRDNRRLLVRWADQHESAFEWEYLRWRCPCAECSGEGNMPGVLQSLPMFRPGQTV